MTHAHMRDAVWEDFRFIGTLSVQPRCWDNGPSNAEASLLLSSSLIRHLHRLKHVSEAPRVQLEAIREVFLNGRRKEQD